MAEIVVGTSGTVLLPDPARCPRHPAWHIREWVTSVDRTLQRDGYHYKRNTRTGECPECGWKPDTTRLEVPT